MLLTSHYLDDIEALSDRVITLSHGKVTFDGTLQALQSLAGPHKRITATVVGDLDVGSIRPLGKLIEVGPSRLLLDVDADRCGPAITELQQMSGIGDLSLANPPLEETLSDLYGDHSP